MTQTPRFLSSICGVALLIPMCQRQARGSTQEVQSTQVGLEATKYWLERYSGSINAGDLAAFGTLWADGADWAPLDARMVRGRQAILEFARPLFDEYTIHHEFTSQAIKVVNGFSVALFESAERYTPRGGEGATWEQSIEAVVLLRADDDGSWVATYFMWNRDAPAAR